MEINKTRYNYFITYFEDKLFDYQAFILKYECINVLLCQEVCPKTQKIHYHMYCESTSRMTQMVQDVKGKGDLKWIREEEEKERVIKYILKDNCIVYQSFCTQYIEDYILP